MNDEVGSLLPSALALGSAGLIALFLGLTRGWMENAPSLMRSAVRTALITVLVQATHFAEELVTGFHERFPALFGLAPMPLRFFVAFNVAWLAIWGLAVWGLAARRRAALFPLWFLGIAGVVNGFAHPSLSVFAGGYFPGLLTSPAIGVLGFLLLRRLLRVTQSGPSSAGPA